MRTPPPVLPPRDDDDAPRGSWLQRLGPDAGLALRMSGHLLVVFTAALFITFAALMTRGYSALMAVPVAFLVALVLTAAVGVFIQRVMDASGAVARAITLPTGASTPYEDQYSFQEAMVAKGDVDGALASYETIITERPDAPQPRLRAAELLARRGRDPERAAMLFRSVRDMPAASSHDALYASNRLVDLYDGPLRDPGRALVELRRIIEKYPTSQAATRARDALPGLKARLASDNADA